MKYTGKVRDGVVVLEGSPPLEDSMAVAVEPLRQPDRAASLDGKSAAISKLRSLASECAQEGWDGDQAAAIHPAAVINTERLLRALPQSVPLPELAPEPDGSLSLDWIQSKTRLFSLSVGAGNRLAYAWLDGTDKGHGVASFDGERIPQRVLEGITATALS